MSRNRDSLRAYNQRWVPRTRLFRKWVGSNVIADPVKRQEYVALTAPRTRSRPRRPRPPPPPEEKEEEGEPEAPPPPPFTYNPGDWHVLLGYSGYKGSDSAWPSDHRFNVMGSPGNAAFLLADLNNTGAVNRGSIGDGEGLYRAFFEMTGITQLAVVDGSSSELNPDLHDNYLVYDLVESTGEESIYDILARLDGVIAETPGIVNNDDSAFNSPSATNLTGGFSGYSGLLVSSGGSGFRTNTNTLPDKVAIKGINFDADNDIQALAFYSGNLQSGKSDSWRGQDPSQTFWSYWGHDFHYDHLTQRIGSSLQSTPGLASGVSTYSGMVYVLARVGEAPGP
jgi:hypothetical protein